MAAGRQCHWPGTQPYRISFDPAIPRTMRRSTAFHGFVLCGFIHANLRAEKEAPKALVFSMFPTLHACTIVPQLNRAQYHYHLAVAPLLSPLQCHYHGHEDMAFFLFLRALVTDFILHPDLPDIPWLGALALCLMRIFLLL